MWSYEAEIAVQESLSVATADIDCLEQIQRTKVNFPQKKSYKYQTHDPLNQYI